MTIDSAKVLLVAILFAMVATCESAEPAKIASRRIRALQKEMSERDSVAAASEVFWKEVEGKCPLIEPIDGDDQHLLVTFLWRGGPTTRQVEVRGGPFASSREPFARLGDSDVWFRCERLPNDARYVYGLVVKRGIERRADNGSMMQVDVEEYPNDRLNPNQFNEGPVVQLPGAPRDAWHINDAATPKGHIEKTTLTSKTLGEERNLTVYIPPGFDVSKRHALAVFFDGEEFETLMNLPTVMDNLISQKKVLPAIVIMVNSQCSRGRDLVFSDPFIKFVADEVVRWAIDRHRLKVSAKETVVGGASLGGLTAAYAAHERPEVFGNVLSQSGAFWRTQPGSNVEDGKGWFPDHVAGTQVTSIRYYLEVGRFEAPAMIENNHRLRDALRAKNNEVTYVECNSGHDHFNWRVSIGRGLMTLIGTDEVP